MASGHSSRPEPHVEESKPPSSSYALLTDAWSTPARRRYGFPPGVGATGTAALLNVPKSLESLLHKLQEQGYDLGEGGIPDGEALVAALSQLDDERATNLGARGLEAEFNRVAAASVQADGESSPLGGLQSGSAAVSPSQLKEWLTFPEWWGPTEWGPIPFLPDNTLLVDRMERQWGDVGSYRGIKSAADGSLVVPGLQLGNVWIGVQVSASTQRLASKASSSTNHGISMASSLYISPRRISPPTFSTDAKGGESSFVGELARNERVPR